MRSIKGREVRDIYIYVQKRFQVSVVFKFYFIFYLIMWLSNNFFLFVFVVFVCYIIIKIL